MSRSRTAAVVAVTTGLVLSGGMASAAQKTVKDKHGDAETATADLHKVKINNAAGNLSVRVKMARASAGRTNLVVTLTPVPAQVRVRVSRAVEPRGVYTVSSVAAEGKGKKFGATLEFVATGSDVVEPVTCEGMKTTISAGKRGNSRFRIPQTCLGDDAGTMKVDVMTVSPDGDVEDEIAKPLKVGAKKAKKQA